MNILVKLTTKSAMVLAESQVDLVCTKDSILMGFHMDMGVSFGGTGITMLDILIRVSPKEMVLTLFSQEKLILKAYGNKDH